MNTNRQLNRLETAANDDMSSVGRDIRALRKSRAMTIVELANQLGRSVGFISQIERGKSKPSISDLRNIAALFDIPLSFFFGKPKGDTREARNVVRAEERRQIGSPDHGLLEELLSPDLGGSYEAIRSEFLPHSALASPVQRDTEETGFVISGSLEIEIDGTWMLLNEGDSFRLNGEPYRWRNSSDHSAILIWIISPPVY